MTTYEVNIYVCKRGKSCVFRVLSNQKNIYGVSLHMNVSKILTDEL